MGKISIQELAATLIERNGLNKKEATSFISALFDLVQQALETDKMVKIKGLGTFKIIDVDDRESVNVNTGERVLIEGHGKITFTPDPIMKELVNKPFSQFETVVLNEGVDFDDFPPETSATVEEAAIPVSQPEPEIEEPQPETIEEPSAMPLVDFVDDAQEEVEDIPEWVIEPVVLPDVKADPEPLPEPVLESEPAPAPESEPDSEPDSEPEHEPESAPAPESLVSEVEEKAEVEDGVDDEVVEDGDEIENEHFGFSKWLIALIACVLGLIAGYLIGSYFPLQNYLSQNEAIVETKTPVRKSVVAPPKQSSPVVKPEVQDAEKDVAEVEKTSEETKAPMPEVKQEPLTPKVEEKKPVVSEPKPEEVDKYAAMDARVRTGAYRIVGTDRVVKVKEGDNLLKISRSTLGPDMECYLEVYNGIKASTVLKPGQEIKIPKLKLKKKKKSQTVNE